MFFNFLLSEIFHPNASVLYWPVKAHCELEILGVFKALKPLLILKIIYALSWKVVYVFEFYVSP